MKYSDWRYELQLHEKINPAAIMGTARVVSGVASGAGKLIGGVASGLGSAVRGAGSAISGRKKTDSQKRIIKTGGIKAARDLSLIHI